MLEKVPDAAGTVGEQVERVSRLDVVGYNQKTEGSAVLGSKQRRGLQPSTVRVGGIRTSSTATAGRASRTTGAD